MSNLSEYSFAIMNGVCHITTQTIDFEYDRRWQWLCRVFGQPSRKRAVLLTLFVGIPLLSLSGLLLAVGWFHAAFYPLTLCLVLIVGMFASFLYDERSYPSSIARNAIVSLTSTPPTAMRLAEFTLTFQSDDGPRQTMFCLPYGSLKERRESYLAVLEGFAANGMIGNPPFSAS